VSAVTSETRRSAHDYRSILANERTFLAWQGMAVSLLLASIAIQCIPTVSMSTAWQVIGIGLAVLTVVTAWTGLRRWGRVDRAIRRSVVA
jgi:uncharacterized membrane protein YidH (DUF202 family)